MYNIDLFWNWFTKDMSLEEKINAEFSSESLQIFKELSGWDIWIDDNKTVVGFNFVSINEQMLLLLLELEFEEYRLLGLGIEHGELIIDFCLDVPYNQVDLHGVVDWNRVAEICGEG